MRLSTAATLLGGAVGPAAVALAQADHAEVVVAPHAAGRLQVRPEAEQPSVLPLSHFPMLVGYAGGEPGWGSLGADDPKHGLFTLSPSSDIAFILITADPGVGVLNNAGAALMIPGELFLFGPPPFDAHPIWNIYTHQAPAPLTLRVRAHDRAGLHPDSPEVVLGFLPDCYANCDGGTQQPVLSASDFVCFAGMFAEGEPNANCDGSTGAPALNV